MSIVSPFWAFAALTEPARAWATVSDEYRLGFDAGTLTRSRVNRTARSGRILRAGDLINFVWTAVNHFQGLGVLPARLHTLADVARCAGRTAKPRKKRFK
jgi:hypothetical protein